MGSLIIVLIILIIAYFAYRVLNKPDHERIINKLGSSIWLVDRSGTGEGASFYIKFGKFEQGQVDNHSGKVHFTKYGQNKAFEYEADMDWSQAGSALRVGQMKLTLTPGVNGLPPTIMFVNNVEGTDSWTAPLKEASNIPSGKL
jgi:hypothetical protein